MRLSDLLSLRDNKTRLDKIRNNRRNVVPFIGAGVSAACGLPTWKELLEILASEYLVKEEREKYSGLDDYLEYAQMIVDASKNTGMLMCRIKEIIEERKIKLTKTPLFIISSFSNNIVTTNYDTILEDAAEKLQVKDEYKVLFPCLKAQMTSAILENRKCIMKMHGTVEEISSLIFTKQQYMEYYGEKGLDSVQALPNFLGAFFKGRSVLFVGCSLSQDRTMEVLSQCIEKNEFINHYAIVELPNDPDAEIRQRNHLSALGILPIYYPEGEYEAVELLIEYLAEDNAFVREARSIIESAQRNVKLPLKKDTCDILISVLKECYYDVGNEFPELFELNNERLNILDEYNMRIEQEDKEGETLYETCIAMFFSLCRSGLRSSERIYEKLIDYFSASILRENEIQEVLKNHYDFYKSKDWDLEGKTDEELNLLAEELILKMQFKSGRDFHSFLDDYNLAIYILEHCFDSIAFKRRMILCSVVGAWGIYVRDAQYSVKYLMIAIQTLELLDKDEIPYNILAQCYCNLGLLKARMGDLEAAINCAKKDLTYKCEIGENPRLIAGSLGNYCLYKKELEPFSAISLHFETSRLKADNIRMAEKCRYQREQNMSINQLRTELILSWATSVFNIGLLAKDMLLYEIADQYISLANKYRFKLLPSKCRDYNASINAKMELQTILSRYKNMEEYINAVGSRLKMTCGLSVTLDHSWYVCALYFMNLGDYKSARRYIRNFKQEFEFTNDIKDLRLKYRMQLLEVQILLKENGKIKEAQGILDEMVKGVQATYGRDSFWLIEIYRIYANISNLYNEELERLRNKYMTEIYQAEEQFKDFYNELVKVDMDLVEYRN